MLTRLCSDMPVLTLKFYYNLFVVKLRAGPFRTDDSRRDRAGVQGVVRLFLAQIFRRTSRNGNEERAVMDVICLTNN